jgi:hypothetical protein
MRLALHRGKCAERPAAGQRIEQPAVVGLYLAILFFSGSQFNSGKVNLPAASKAADASTPRD